MDSDFEMSIESLSIAVTLPFRSVLKARMPVGGIFLLSGIGFIALLICTRWGIGASPDSAVYIGAARNLLAGYGLSVPFGNAVNSPLTQFPPLYPAVLAAVGTLKIDPAEVARWLNASLLAANILLVALIVRQISRQSTPAMLVGALLALISPSLLTLHVMAWSESLFILLGFTSLSSLARYLDAVNRKWLLVAGVMVGLAILTRYAGVVFLIVGVIAILTIHSRSLRHKAGHGLVFGSIAALPALLWSIRNLRVAGTATNRSLSFHPLGASHLWQVLDTVSAWLVVPNTMSNGVKIGVVLTVAAGCGASLYLWRREKQIDNLRSLAAEIASLPNMVKVLVLFNTLYICFLLSSISFVDANTPLDERILSPVYVASLILLLYGAENFSRLRGRARPLQVALIAAGLVIGGLSIYRDASLLVDGYWNGIGFNHRTWRDSLTLAHVRKLPADTLIYSNSPEVIYLWTRRTALRLPRSFDLMEQQPNANYFEEMSAMKMRLHSEGGVVVYFKAIQSSSLPTSDALSTALSLAPVAEAADGVIFAPASTP